MQLGSKLGKPVNIDDTTNQVSRGHFAHICVEVDLSKPLVSRFQLHTCIFRVEYEGIHLGCFGPWILAQKRVQKSLQPLVTTAKEPAWRGQILVSS